MRALVRHHAPKGMGEVRDAASGVEGAVCGAFWGWELEARWSADGRLRNEGLGQGRRVVRERERGSVSGSSSSSSSAEDRSFDWMEEERKGILGWL